MPTITFERVIAWRRKQGACPHCGRKTSRARSFEQTINPWNVNADGVPKSRSEVRASVEAAANAWTPDFAHAKCKEDR